MIIFAILFLLILLARASVHYYKKTGYTVRNHFREGYKKKKQMRKEYMASRKKHILSKRSNKKKKK